MKILVGVVFASFLASACGGSRDEDPKVTVEDFELRGFFDDNQDGLSYNDAPRTTRLSDFFVENSPGTKIIMINAAAGWCGPCQSEAGAINAFAAMYQPRGVTILTAIFQDNDGKPANDEFAQTWGENFQLSIPTLVDSEFVTGKYFDANTMPSNMFVDAETKEILEIATGAEPGDDPMREYAELLDYFLAE